MTWQKMAITIEIDEQMFLVGKEERMCLGDWRRKTAGMADELPLLFRFAEEEPVSFDDYFAGEEVEQGRYWERREGWQPCVLVTLRKEM